MKTSKQNKLLGLALIGSYSLFNASSVLAAANDLISNRATLSYDVGAVAQTVIESGSGPGGNAIPGVGAGNDTQFREDRVINFTVTRENGAAVPAVPGGNQQAIPYLVDNTGNDTHGFLLAGIHNSGALDPFGGAADDITPTIIETYVDANNNAVLDPAEIVPANAYIASLAPDDTAVRVFVVANIPLVDDAANPLVNGDIAVMSLVAHAAVNGTAGAVADAIVIDDNGHFSTGGTFTNGNAVVPDASGSAVTNPDTAANMETVFNDGAFVDAVTGATVDGTGLANDVIQNAQHSSYSSYSIQTAALTVTKTSAALWDFVNLNVSPKSIPGGSVIRYTVRIDNTGTVAADLTQIEDILPLVLDTQFGAGDAANGPLAAAGTDNIRITDGATTVTFCTANNGDSNGDGCRDNGGVGNNALVVDLAAAAGTATLNGGEFLTVEFDVILP